MSKATRSVPVVRVEASVISTTDVVAVEAPLDVRLDGVPFSVIMRTPGDDGPLAAGFLFSEGILQSAADLQSMDLSADIADAMIAAGARLRRGDRDPVRRPVTMNASCGVCGRSSLESLGLEGPPLTDAWRIGAVLVRQMPIALGAAQAAFAETGGLHGAALFDSRGDVVTSAEDVGRHNAVDKVVGRMLIANRLPLAGHALFVSGRSSFEIIQKAYRAGIPLVAGVSAPSSLAVELAARMGMTLLGFVRGDRFNVYAHPHRVDI
jgi:FdhD protein